MTDQEVIKILTNNVNVTLLTYGSKLPFHFNEFVHIKEFSRPYFNVFKINDFEFWFAEDGGCQYVNYKDKRYYSFKLLKAAGGV